MSDKHCVYYYDTTSSQCYRPQVGWLSRAPGITWFIPYCQLHYDRILARSQPKEVSEQT